jgi:hypothetical protein
MFAQDYAGTKFGDYWNHLADLPASARRRPTNSARPVRTTPTSSATTPWRLGNARARATPNNGATWGNALGQVGGIGANYLNNTAR